MTATLNDVTPRKKRPEPSAEERAAAELVRLAKEQGLVADRAGRSAQAVDRHHLHRGRRHPPSSRSHGQAT
jgi:hypothetical protein